MVPLTSLWVPILVSAVLVFIASSVMHMLLTYHQADYRKLPAEDETMDALRRYTIPPGDYMVPCGGGMASMKDPAFLAKMNKGPVLTMTVMPTGVMAMGGTLAQWFAYCVLVSIVSAYIASRALGPGASYLEAFRFAGTTAFASYSLGLWQQSIWYKRSWATTVRYTIDGLVFGLLTGGAFGWLWPPL
jgi:hypothetical protein